MSSDLENKILTSPAGARIINYNTTGFYSESLVGLWLYQVIGLEIDDLIKWVDEIKWQRFPQTVTWGISWWEEAYRLPVDESLSLEARRRRLRTRGRLGGPINPARIEQLVKDATGYDARVTEHVAPYTFQVDVQTGTLEILDPFCIYRLLMPRKQSHKSMRINFQIEEKPGIVQIGAVTEAGNTTEIYPFHPTKVYADGNFVMGGYSLLSGSAGVVAPPPIRARAIGNAVSGAYCKAGGQIGMLPFRASSARAKIRFGVGAHNSLYVSECVVAPLPLKADAAGKMKTGACCICGAATGIIPLHPKHIRAQVKSRIGGCAQIFVNTGTLSILPLTAKTKDRFGIGSYAICSIIVGVLPKGGIRNHVS